MGARELEKLARQFKSSGDNDIAQGISAWAQVARARGRETFSLPEGVIRLPDVTIGGVKPGELGKLLTANGHRVSNYAEDLMQKMPTLPDQQTISLVRATVSAMGLSGNPTTDQIYKKADELGWNLCPAEVGPHLRLAYKDQPMNEWLNIAMKQISDRYGNPSVFDVGRDVDGLWLGAFWAGPSSRWFPRDQLVFSPRK
ncbi:MAG: hypothetical protein A3B44_02350 [Candidatus Levybacteria bacterium RIFCSPLOWO2_01_FULL_38_21]|nr:MAG: hypothetical protein A3B44_02350 [Candidatus Levybacteria bacterium RIFCSPLOWO2_01_FULL_38_21]